MAKPGVRVVAGVDLNALAHEAQRHAAKCYEFAPSSYSYDAMTAVRRLATEIARLELALSSSRTPAVDLAPSPTVPELVREARRVLPRLTKGA